MEIEFVSGVAVIAPDPARVAPPVRRHPRAAPDKRGRRLLSQRADTGNLKHFGVWPLSQAAQACFGSEQWPAHVAVPQVSVEFDVADAARVQDAADELAGAGYELLHPVRQEPWGQTVVRLLSPEGAIVGISYIPSMHE